MTEPIVLLHGWGFTPAVWQPVIQALTRAGIGANRIQYPALPLDAPLNHKELVNRLAQQLPAKSHLVGWSLGGQAALALAEALPERVTTLTLISSTPCFVNCSGWSAGQPASLLDDFAQRLADNPQALIKRFSTLIRHGDADAIRNPALSEILTQTAEFAVDRLANGLSLLRSLDLRPVTLPTTLPVTVVHGVADAVVPIAAANTLLLHPKAHLVTIEGGSHALIYTHPDHIATAIVHACGARNE